MLEWTMSDAPDLTTWQQIGALLGTAIAGLGIGRVSKRDAKLIEAIGKMERTLADSLSELRADIRLLLDRGEHPR